LKIQIASDLHFEILERQFPDYRMLEHTDADMLVIAGDIHRQTRAFDIFRDWPVPVVYVHGNHEFYHDRYAAVSAQLQSAAAAQQRIRYLERDVFVSGGVRFLGCCLWSDFLLGPASEEDAKQQSDTCLMDSKAIALADGSPFNAAAVQAIHRESRAWLERQLAVPFDGKTVVVTHHAPHPGSIHPRFAGSPLNAAFISDLTPLLDRVDLWIHGHVHDSVDYRVGRARVIANPRGYPKNRKVAQSPQQLEWENPLFDPALVVEL